jgi:putative protein kinase ArgK-like GTPase of G3E family
MVGVEPTLLSNADAVAVITAQVGSVVPPAGMRTRIVGIDGLGGAGKSTRGDAERGPRRRYGRAHR